MEVLKGIFCGCDLFGLLVDELEVYNFGVMIFEFILIVLFCVFVVEVVDDVYC